MDEEIARTLWKSRRKATEWLTNLYIQAFEHNNGPNSLFAREDKEDPSVAEEMATNTAFDMATILQDLPNNKQAAVSIMLDFMLRALTILRTQMSSSTEDLTSIPTPEELEDMFRDEDGDKDKED